LTQVEGIMTQKEDIIITLHQQVQIVL